MIFGIFGLPSIDYPLMAPVWHQREMCLSNQHPTSYNLIANQRAKGLTRFAPDLSFAFVRNGGVTLHQNLAQECFPFTAK